MSLPLNTDEPIHVKKRCQETGKVIHTCRKEASDALAKLKRAASRTDEMGKRIKHRSLKPSGKRIYYCSFCRGYHLTSRSWWQLGTKRQLAHLFLKENKIALLFSKA
ncbi:hypothetical protein ACLOAU_04135 [Niabella sp. CJ426]|uniref:hypothetical protein n=1 Tax=Niabella sp. CJ426 TaxID=3393740 RepID=UPI003D0865CC